MGLALGLLVTVEFFVSSELVLIGAVAGAVAVVLIVGYAAVRDPADLRWRLPRAATGLGIAFAVTAVLLAYPVWFFLAGPAHLSGMVWSTNIPGDLGNTVGNFWSHLGRYGSLDSRALAQEAPVLGGYGGPATPSPSYLGPGALAVLVTGAIWWRRDRRLWLFGALGLVTAVLSLRVGGGQGGPWAFVYHLPQFRNVVQSRFSAIVGLCAAVMLGVIVDSARAAALEWYTRRRRIRTTDPSRRDISRAHWLAATAALVVTAVALGPVAAVLAPNIPLTVQSVSVPAWFEHAAPRLPPGQVVLTYPFATADSQASIPWQAIGKMHYLMAGGGGPSGTVARAGADTAGFAVLRDASVPLLVAPALTAGNLQAVREAMGHWKVNIVVVPEDTHLPTYQRARGTAYGVAFFSAVLGSTPTRQDDAWVWPNVTRAPLPVAVPASVVSTCLGGPSAGAVGALQVARCVLQAPSQGAGAGG